MTIRAACTQGYAAAARTARRCTRRARWCSRIDDEPGVRESLRLILEGEFEVLEAADGAAALAILGARRVDVALLDVRMPGEPGSRVLPQILAIDESIPVILITADPHLRTAVDAMKAGAYDYLAKPFDVDEILRLVRQARPAARHGARARTTCGPSSTARTASTSWWAAIPEWSGSTS